MSINYQGSSVNVSGYRLMTMTYQMKVIDLWILPRETNNVSILQPWGHHTKLVGHTSPTERK